MITALLSIKAEYIALSEAVHKGHWLRSLFFELGFMQVLPTTIWGNNEGSIAMTKNPQFHKRSKHIGLQYHSIREQVHKGEIIIKNCRTQNQTADVLIKPLPRAKHKQHTAEMGLVSAWRGVLGCRLMVCCMPDSTLDVLYIVTTLHHAWTQIKGTGTQDNDLSLT